MKKEKLGRVDVKRKSLRQSLMEWKDSLHWDKPQNVMLAATAFVLVSAFLIFNNLSVPYARHWDIEWGYYSILLTFLLLVAGVVVKAYPRFLAERQGLLRACAFAHRVLGVHLREHRQYAPRVERRDELGVHGAPDVLQAYGRRL